MTDGFWLAASREAGLERLDSFLPSAGHQYATERNYDLGPSDRSNVSLLSPYVSTRTVAEWEVCDAVLDRHQSQSSEKFLEEVLWRTYWKGWLEYRPQVWREFLRAVGEAEPFWARREDYRDALAGETGLEAFDIWTRELVEYGYLHNHARMWYASLWIFELRLPWALGALQFYRHLLDGDAASNTLSWRWVAGLHTQGKRYFARAENVHKYTKGRLRLPKDVDRTSPGPPASGTPQTSRPVRLAQTPSERLGIPFALLVTPDDLSPEVGPLSGLCPAVCIVLEDELETGPTKLSHTVCSFRGELVTDACRRLEEHFQKPVVRLPFGSGSQIALGVGDAMSQYACRDLVYYQPAVGRFGDRLGEAVHTWAKQDSPPRLFPLRRKWDESLFPHAQKGFFSFKKAVFPNSLRSLSIS